MENPMGNEDSTLTYFIERQFDDRMWDMYSGLANLGPPFWDDISIDSLQIKALLLLHRRGSYYGTEKEYKKLYQAVWSNDEQAVITVLNKTPEHELNTVLVDAFIYIKKNNLSLLFGQSCYKNVREAGLMNPPVTEVW